MYTSKTIMSAEVESRLNQAYADLHRWIRWLCATTQIRGHWLMNVDDLIAESYLVLVKVSKIYINKPYKEFILLAKTSIHNMIGSMKYKCGLTHRKIEFSSLSLDTSDEDTSDGELSEALESYLSNMVSAFSDNLMEMGLNPEHYVEEAEKFNAMIDKLSNFELRVLNAIIGGDDRMLLYIELAIERRGYVYTNAKITITPLMVARALCESESEVKRAFKHIRELI